MALDMPFDQGEAPTERPAETVVGSVHDLSAVQEPPSFSASRLLLVGAIAFLLLGAAAALAWRMLESRASEAAARKQTEDLRLLQMLGRETQIDLARSELG